ncbi:hypothetical protein AMATHDRAFT_4137 [Amanita thiersii Skay4041]|uniref:Uncharacterized protein n=1 Tax=Amanita thiersii Skay4041 TaxID=703135 RepID=A0A2A9NGU8_9AGAR|nr:hypothetical protein AMATHDRAFT_4137 [Amanita thiersii Skay4041]
MEEGNLQSAFRAVMPDMTSRANLKEHPTWGSSPAYIKGPSIPSKFTGSGDTVSTRLVKFSKCQIALAKAIDDAVSRVVFTADTPGSS